MTPTVFIKIEIVQVQVSSTVDDSNKWQKWLKSWFKDPTILTHLAQLLAAGWKYIQRKLNKKRPKVATHLCYTERQFQWPGWIQTSSSSKSSDIRNLETVSSSSSKTGPRLVYVHWQVDRHSPGMDLALDLDPELDRCSLMSACWQPQYKLSPSLGKSSNRHSWY